MESPFVRPRVKVEIYNTWNVKMMKVKCRKVQVYVIESLSRRKKDCSLVSNMLIKVFFLHQAVEHIYPTFAQNIVPRASTTPDRH